MPPVQESLSELRQRYVVEGRPLPASLQTALEEDGRAGARAILAAVERRRKKNRAEGQRLRKMLRYERALYRKGLTLLAGVDEVGMSPLAGPTRERLAEEIRREAVCFAIGAVEPEEIDRINIYRAGLLSMRRALEGLARTPEHVLIDARRLDEVRLPQTPIIKGDAKSLSIAAASIVAKVHRDNLMVELDARYPGYGLAKHKGYPVKEHQDALRSLGVTPIHRRSFRPVRIAMGIEPEQLELVPGE